MHAASTLVAAPSRLAMVRAALIRVALVLLAMPAMSGCYITTLDEENLACPCGPGFACINNVCVLSRRDASGTDGGTVPLDAFLPGDGGSTEIDAFAIDAPTVPADTNIDAFVVPPDAFTPDAPGSPRQLRAYALQRCNNGALTLSGQGSVAATLNASTNVVATVVHYTIAGSARSSGCTAAKNHHVDIWVQAQGTPLNTIPTGAFRQAFTAPAGAADYVGTVTLPMPLAVNAGQALVVAITPDNNSNPLCLSGCSSAMPQMGVGWVALLGGPPYAWQDLTMMVAFNPEIEADLQ